jgi:hypothetical protein
MEILKLWERHPQSFARHFYDWWLYTDYHQHIGNILRRYLCKAKQDKKVYYIFIAMPPRAGKTEFTDAVSIPWAMNLYPSLKVLLLTHTMQLSQEYSVRVRDFIKENGSELRVQVKPGETKAQEWATIQGGRFKCAGLGTGIQGKGYNLIVLDDLIKNRQAANSEAIRAQIRSLLTGTIRGRFQPGFGLMWVPMTRWDNQDPAAYIQDILQSTGRSDQLVMLKFPALSKGADIDLLQRPLDAPLAPIFTIESLKEIRDFCTVQEWASQYQCEPRNNFGQFFLESQFRHLVEEESLYKWINKSGEPQTIMTRDLRLRTFQFWDTALTEEEDSAYSVCITVKVWHNGSKWLIFVVDVLRIKVDVADLLEKIQWKATLNKPLKVFVEDVPGSKGLLQSSKKAGVPLYGIKPAGKSKEERALTLQYFYQCGSVFHLKRTLDNAMPWLADFEKELISFPGKYKDQVDALTYCAMAILSDTNPKRKDSEPYYGVAHGVSTLEGLNQGPPIPAKSPFLATPGREEVRKFL